MARDFARGFYNSKAWERCREAFKLSKFGLCNRCSMPGEEVHHKIHLSPDNINDPNITLSWDNLELLCQSCHSIEHNRAEKEVVREGLEFNAYGDLVETE